MSRRFKSNKLQAEREKLTIAKVMNITKEQFPEKFSISPIQDVEVNEMVITYEKYEKYQQAMAENDRLTAQLADFKKSVFYKIYKWFN